MNNRRILGQEKEALAGRYLQERGYEILEYNFRTRRGEIDIIAREGDYLVFCEVKYRRDGAKGHPGESVDFKKQRKISLCALNYITFRGMEGSRCRFDVVSIEGETVTLHRNAFDFAGY